jgi:hypothetical protein
MAIFLLLLTLQDVQIPQDPSLETIVNGARTRARRSVAIGPTLGGAVLVAPSPGEGDGAISFGLELNWFKVPVVPDLATIRELIQERFKARLKERLMHLQSPDDAMVRQVYEDVKNEVLGELNVRPHTWEDPQASLALEALYLFRAEAWQVRSTVAIGISKFTLGPSIVVFHTSGLTDLLLGGELAAHLLPTDSVRSPVIDLFLRLDIPVVERDTDATQLIFGGRLQLDLI